MESPLHDTVKDIKHQFYLNRNGVVSDTLRKAIPYYTTIFGLTLPEISKIAEEHGKDTPLGLQLWSDQGVRECLLLAPMLIDFHDLTDAQALQMANTAPTTEVADVLCLKLLKYMPDAAKLANQAYSESNSPIQWYTALRWVMNLLPQAQDEARTLAVLAEAAHEPLSSPLAHQILQRLDQAR